MPDRLPPALEAHLELIGLPPRREGVVSHGGAGFAPQGGGGSAPQGDEGLVPHGGLVSMPHGGSVSVPHDGYGFVPPGAVILAARQGLMLRARHRRGGTAVGLARAEGLAAARPVPAAQMRVMAGWFARFGYLHGRGGWDDAARPSTGYIAWMLWGGDAGRAWVEAMRVDWAA